MRWSCLAVVLAGCVGSPVHSTMRYHGVQDTISQNNRNLIDLHIGMPRAEVLELMGPPERSEGYGWGSALLYRTAMTSGIYGTADSDFTPVVLDPDGRVLGWGRNFFAQQVNRYEMTIRKE